MTLSTAQIGRAGELLVQLRLLALGIESAPLTTDTGVDLVAYSPSRTEAVTIQVKTNLKPKPGGGKGKPALDWWIAVANPAQYVALVDLSTESVWLLSQAEVAELAQQKSSGRYHFYMYTDATVKLKAGKMARIGEFDKYRIERRAEKVFGA